MYIRKHTLLMLQFFATRTTSSCSVAYCSLEFSLTWGLWWEWRYEKKSMLYCWSLSSNKHAILLLSLKVFKSIILVLREEVLWRPSLYNNRVCIYWTVYLSPVLCIHHHHILYSFFPPPPPPPLSCWKWKLKSKKPT